MPSLMVRGREGLTGLALRAWGRSLWADWFQGAALVDGPSLLLRRIRPQSSKRLTFHLTCRLRSCKNACAARAFGRSNPCLTSRMSLVRTRHRASQSSSSSRGSCHQRPSDVACNSLMWRLCARFMAGTRGAAARACGRVDSGAPGCRGPAAARPARPARPVRCAAW